MGESRKVEYVLTPAQGEGQRFVVEMDADTLELVHEPRAEAPEWTALEFMQCGNCPLNPETTPRCPVAERVVDLVELCHDLCSYEEMELEVTTPERHITRSTTAQRAVSSLMGLVFATSGCPHLKLFRPMARFHLPLASEEETIYRVTSMYLLAQYFRRRNGREADLELEGLVRAYQEIQVVNRALADRLRAAVRKDASVNALILLDLLSKALPDTIDDSLQEIEYLFAPVLESLRTPAAEAEAEAGTG